MKNKYLFLIIIAITLGTTLFVQQFMVDETSLGGIVWKGVTNTNTDITTSSATVILDNNPARRKAIITKCIGDNNVYLRFEVAATTTYSTATAYSFTMNASTTNQYIIEPDNNGDIWSGIVTAVSDLDATSTCLINTFEY